MVHLQEPPGRLVRTRKRLEQEAVIFAVASPWGLAIVVPSGLPIVAVALAVGVAFAVTEFIVSRRPDRSVRAARALLSGVITIPSVFAVHAAAERHPVRVAAALGVTPVLVVVLGAMRGRRRRSRPNAGPGEL